MKTISDVEYFCLDDSGYLYGLMEDANATVTLAKYTLNENDPLWGTKDLPIGASSLWYLHNAGLLLLSGFQEQWLITAVNAKSSVTENVVLDIGTDTDIGKELSLFIGYHFGISTDGQIDISVIVDYDINSENPYCNRYTWKLEAFIPEIHSADAVTFCTHGSSSIPAHYLQ